MKKFAWYVRLLNFMKKIHFWSPFPTWFQMLWKNALLVAQIFSRTTLFLKAIVHFTFHFSVILEVRTPPLSFFLFFLFLCYKLENSYFLFCFWQLILSVDDKCLDLFLSLLHNFLCRNLIFCLFWKFKISDINFFSLLWIRWCAWQSAWEQ